MFDLTTHPLIAALPEDLRADALARSPAQAALPGDRLFYQGDPTRAVMIVLATLASLWPALRAARLSVRDTLAYE